MRPYCEFPLFSLRELVSWESSHLELTREIKYNL